MCRQFGANKCLIEAIDARCEGLLLSIEQQSTMKEPIKGTFGPPPQVSHPLVMRKERKASFASTADETMTDAASIRSDPDNHHNGASSSLHSSASPRFGSFSRAANYLMRRGSISKKRGSEIIQSEEMATSSKSSSSSSYAEYSSDYGRVKDMFATELNRCSSLQEIAQLRHERAVEHPIICYESDDDEDLIENGSSICLYKLDEGGEPFSGKSEGSPDLAASEKQPASQQNTSLRALLGMSSSKAFRCNACRASYLPKSVHVSFPHAAFPMQQQQ